MTAEEDVGSLLLEVEMGRRGAGAADVRGVIGALPGLEEGNTGISPSSNCGVIPAVVPGWGPPRRSDRAWEDSLSSSRNSPRFSWGKRTSQCHEETCTLILGGTQST